MAANAADVLPLSLVRAELEIPYVGDVNPGYNDNEDARLTAKSNTALRLAGKYIQAAVLDRDSDYTVESNGQIAFDAPIVFDSRWFQAINSISVWTPSDNIYGAASGNIAKTAVGIERNGVTVCVLPPSPNYVWPDAKRIRINYKEGLLATDEDFDIIQEAALGIVGQLYHYKEIKITDKATAILKPFRPLSSQVK